MCTNKFSMAGVYLRDSRVGAVVDVDVVKVVKLKVNFVHLKHFFAKAGNA